MRKYLTIFQLSWQSGLVYRTSLFMWRFRQFLSTLMSLTIWSVVFNGQNHVFGYSRPEMTGYVLLVSILQSVILATSLHGLSGEIYSGNISQHLLKPEKLFLSFAAVEVADKLKNFLFGIIEGALLIWIFQPVITLPALGSFFLFLLWTFLGTVIYFYITILFGTLGFWSPESWAPKFLFFMIIDFTAGKLFPLDILPNALKNFLMLTPFPYFSYIQIQLFLGRLEPREIVQFTLGIIVWAVLSAALCNQVWNLGMKKYEAAGQ